MDQPSALDLEFGEGSLSAGLEDAQDDLRPVDDGFIEGLLEVPLLTARQIEGAGDGDLSVSCASNQLAELFELAGANRER